MKSIKLIKKQAIKAAQLSFKNGKLDEAAAKKFVKAFRSLPLSEAVLTLNHYLRALRTEINKTTLTIESAIQLSSSTVKEIENSFKSYRVQNTITTLTPSILGGVKVRIGDVIFDNSLKARINQVKEVLVN